MFLLESFRIRLLTFFCFKPSNSHGFKIEARDVPLVALLAAFWSSGQSAAGLAWRKHGDIGHSCRCKQKLTIAHSSDQIFGFEIVFCLFSFVYFYFCSCNKTY